MKHPVRDRLVILLCALAVLCAAAGVVAFLAGQVTLEPVMEVLNQFAGEMTLKKQLILGAVAIVLVLFAILLIGMVFPAKKKRSSNFAFQQNETGMVRISLKALEALVHRCLSQHPELKVISSSLFSDEESVRVDVHITLQSDISMPLAVSALQKQIKRYLEACTGVCVEEVRVFVDGTMNPGKNAEKSPYSIPAELLGGELTAGEEEEGLILEVPAEDAPAEEPAVAEAAEDAPAQEDAAQDIADAECPEQEAESEAPVTGNEGE